MYIYKDITIIGGGASGLICACRAANRYEGKKKILILEKENRVGKKLLVTGNGRCNLTNINASNNDYNGDNDKIINILFEKYNPKTVISFFNSIGLLEKIEDDGRVYPRSKQASSVLNVLRNDNKGKLVEELCDVKIKKINKLPEGYEIVTDSDNIVTKKLVIATGGLFNHASQENLSSKNILKSLGYEMTNTSPALSPIRVKNDIIKSLKGIRVEGKVSLLKDNEILKEETGEIQFTQNGLSGICIFNLSRRPNIEKDMKIRLSLLPEYSDDQIKKILVDRCEYLGFGDLNDLFIGIFHKNIGLALLKEANISVETNANDLTDKDFDKLIYLINNWDFETVTKHDYQNAQVTAGGVPIDKIDINTFETKDNKDIYIIGEALNIDGNCGGFNLQFAFASGLCCADNL